MLFLLRLFTSISLALPSFTLAVEQMPTDCTEILKSIQQPLGLDSTVPHALYFLGSQCLYQQQRHDDALMQLENYFTFANKGDKYYQQAAELFMQLENQPAHAVSTPTDILDKNTQSRLQQIKSLSSMRMVHIEKGCFSMGSPVAETERADEEKAHTVCITRPFLMSAFEVTQAQWESIMGGNPAHFKDCGAQCPIENISWQDIQIFIRKLNKKSGLKFRLPTEAEWEYAARAGSTTPFAFGHQLTTAQANYDGDHPYSGKAIGRDRKQPTAVGSLKANAWGLYDMHGNVMEVVADWHHLDYYSVSPKNNPKGPRTGSFRVRRGGSWRYGARFCRSSFRGRVRPEAKTSLMGFRLVMHQ